MAIDENVQQRVTTLYAEGTTKAAEIFEVLNEDLEMEGMVPSERSIYRMLAEIKAGYTTEQMELDGPFEFRRELPEGITDVGLPLIGKVMNFVNEWPRAPRLSIRAAAWVARLRPLVSPEISEFGVENLYWAVMGYASRERWALIHQREFHTGDLDVLMLYQPWNSSEADNHYKDLDRYWVISDPRHKPGSSDLWGLNDSGETPAGRHIGVRRLGTYIQDIQKILPERMQRGFWLTCVSICKDPLSSTWDDSQIIDACLSIRDKLLEVQELEVSVLKNDPMAVRSVIDEGWYREVMHLQRDFCLGQMSKPAVVATIPNSSEELRAIQCRIDVQDNDEWPSQEYIHNFEEIEKTLSPWFREIFYTSIRAKILQLKTTNQGAISPLRMVKIAHTIRDLLTPWDSLTFDELDEIATDFIDEIESLKKGEFDEGFDQS